MRIPVKPSLIVRQLQNNPKYFFTHIFFRPILTHIYFSAQFFFCQIFSATKKFRVIFREFWTWIWDTEFGIQDLGFGICDLESGIWD